MHETWGIPGPTFIGLFWMAGALLVIGALAYRTIASYHRSSGGPLEAEHAAYLSGGPRLAAYASLGALRGAGAVSVNNKRVYSGNAPLPRGATPLDYATYEATASGCSAAKLPKNPQIKAQLAQIRDALERAGMMFSPTQRAVMRALRWSGWALVIVGIARIVAGVAADKPVGGLIASVILFAILILFITRIPARTQAGSAALNQLRQQHAHLAPAQAPAFNTYGPAAVAMGIGLFGLGTFFALDPAFAADAGLKHSLGTGGSDGGSGCGGSSCSSSSCGSSCGGGCGGGCGG